MAALYESLKSLYGKDKYSDLVVICGDGPNIREFKLHRAIICPQSEFFEKACSGGFQVSCQLESCNYPTGPKARGADSYTFIVVDQG